MALWFIHDYFRSWSRLAILGPGLQGPVLRPRFPSESGKFKLGNILFLLEVFSIVKPIVQLVVILSGGRSGLSVGLCTRCEVNGVFGSERSKELWECLRTLNLRNSAVVAFQVLLSCARG